MTFYLLLLLVLLHPGSSYLPVISIDPLLSLWHFSKDISSIVSYPSIIRKPPTSSRSVIAATILIIYLSRLFKGHRATHRAT